MEFIQLWVAFGSEWTSSGTVKFIFRIQKPTDGSDALDTFNGPSLEILIFEPFTVHLIEKIPL